MRRAPYFIAALMMGIALLVGAQSAGAAENVVTPIGQITTEYADRFATVQGKVAGERAFKSGTRYTIEDATGKITLVLFDRELKQVPKRSLLTDGATVKATGKVDFYKEEAQIVPVRGTDVVVLAAAPVMSPTRVGGLSLSDKDKRVVVTGQVDDAVNFSAGFKLMLNDGTGRIAVVLFESVFDGLARSDAVNVGATLTVTGRVDEFGGALQLIPSSAGGVAVASPPEREVPAYALGKISGNDHNAVVRLEGDVSAIEPFEDGINVVLKDDSGAQKLRLYQIVAKRVPLKVGDKINVIGRVRASKRGIAIDVAMPGDVIVTK